MEDKRILWVSAAVGIFLLIIVGTALVLYAPSRNGDLRLTGLPAETETPRILHSQPPVTSGQDQNPLSKGNQAEQGSTLQNIPPAPSAHPSLEAPNVGNTDSGTTAETTGIVQGRDLTVISNNTTVYTKDGLTTIDLSALAARPEQKPVDVPRDMQAAADVKTLVPINPSEYMSTGTTAGTDSGTISGISVKPKTTSPTKADSSGKATAQTKNSKTKTNPVKTPATKPVQKQVDRYWVQAASFTDKANAETARSVLADEKIPAEVFTYKDKKGLTYYRLRVGPYTTESEAEYWNSRIKLIDHFASSRSYVTNSSKAAQ